MNLLRVVLLVLLAYGAIGTVGIASGASDARAACASGEPACTQAEAYAACMALSGTEQMAGWGTWTGAYECVTGPDPQPDYGYYYGRRAYKQYNTSDEWANTQSRFWQLACPNGSTWDEATHTCKAPPSCSANDPPLDRVVVPVPPGTATNPWINTPIGACVDGCAYYGSIEDAAHFVIDGQKFVSYGNATATGQACAAGDPDFANTTTPPSDSDGDGTSDAKDGAPDNPGSDGTDGPQDTDGDGTPDCGGEGQAKCPDKTDGSDHKSAGGGDCSTPPVSSGDPILAQIAFQTWATRCAVQANANVKTPGGDKPGEDPMDLSEGTGAQLGLNSGDLWDDSDSDIDIDMGGFGLQRTCPQPPTISIAGYSRTIDTAGLCEGAGILGTIVLIAAAAQAAYIFASRNS